MPALTLENDDGGSAPVSKQRRVCECWVLPLLAALVSMQTSCTANGNDVRLVSVFVDRRNTHGHRYTERLQIIPPWAHNPEAIHTPDGEVVVYTLGNGIPLHGPE